MHLILEDAGSLPDSFSQSSDCSAAGRIGPLACMVKIFAILLKKDCTCVVNLLSEEESCVLLQVKILNNLECPFLYKESICVQFFCSKTNKLLSYYE